MEELDVGCKRRWLASAFVGLALGNVLQRQSFLSKVGHQSFLVDGAQCARGQLHPDRSIHLGNIDPLPLQVGKLSTPRFIMSMRDPISRHGPFSRDHAALRHSVSPSFFVYLLGSLRRPSILRHGSGSVHPSSKQPCYFSRLDRFCQIEFHSTMGTIG